jgi:hypothetical protein
MTPKEGDFLTLLNKFTDEELEEELQRRKDPPDPLASEDVNISNLRTHVENYIKYIHEQGCPPKDAEHFMFEAVMTTFYGNDIWSWLNKFNKG